MKVAVLGGSGFVGAVVAERLAGAGLGVRVVARNPGWSPHEVVRADLTEPGRVAEVVAGVDVVLSLVLHTGSGSWRVGPGQAAAAEAVNVGIVRAAAASGVPVVVAGSTSQVGPGWERIDGSEPDAPESEYDRQKLAAERIVVAAGGCCLRLPTVYGPGPLDRGVVSAMARRAMAGEALTVWGDGSMLRDLVFVEDVAEAFLLAVRHLDALRGRHWVIGSGQGVPVRTVFEMIAAAVAERTGRPPVPVLSVPPPPHATAMDLRGLVADPRAFTEVTGWRAATGLAEGVARVVASTKDTAGTPILGP
ncbi:NAD-dependent epimerase/dehydratase family protein [Actinokineospora fastidiosa]|uniref:NAD-dependent dehydratase n=1 Tax=Actinokineospora fastidiosa TaxID=1816 RepID=A0A918G493_9PSEU|nr:NAD-dependent epimerase/dehydratase family protein [Actinokineospora fastidiosa]GGS16372.1 NAD-dependent dehydratase [Actinokineospora fastidiosa]